MFSGCVLSSGTYVSVLVSEHTGRHSNMVLPQDIHYKAKNTDAKKMEDKTLKTTQTTQQSIERCMINTIRRDRKY